MIHDPIDSLIHLDRALPLDYLSEQMGEHFGYADENEYVADLTAVIDSIKATIRKEVLEHYDGRTEYSTGVPFYRRYRYASSEPDGQDGEIPVIAEATVMMHPDGSPREPHDGGKWID